MTMTPVSSRAAAAFVAVGCLFLPACASDGHLVSAPEAMAKSSWKGHPISEAMVKWGIPVAPPVHAADGTILYQWGGSAKYTYDQQTGYATTAYGTVDFYEKRIGSGGCGLSISTDANGIITNLETAQEVRSCSDFLWASGYSPTDETAAKGRILAQQLRAIQALDERFKALCANPDYAALFDQSHCSSGRIQVAAGLPAPKLTPAQRSSFATWNREMTAIANAYRAFFLSTGKPEDQAMMGALDAHMPTYPDDSLLQQERATAMRINQLVSYSRVKYRQFDR